MKYKYLLLVLTLLASTLQSARAQSDAPPKYEFRGAWIATVINLDWPGSPNGSTSFQQAELEFMLDRLKEAGINAVFFQVRSEADAMYQSEIEPWSYWLTGRQGEAPEPFYDPLAFAIEEAHERGMELHAWFNPYRAVRGSGYAQAANHVSVEHPEWTLQFDNLTVLNPGLPEVRDYNTNVIMDVVTRYDIDGVHFDDYFYPYPPNQVTNEDVATFAEHSRGISNIGDWRRDNVDIFVEQVYDSIQAVKPEVVFGISPFGIWKNGVPSGIVGLDAYNVIFGDATAWYNEETIDYLTPQLYWAFGGGQDYGKLARGWETQRNDRHLYPGHGLYRSDSNTFSRALFSSSEIPRQVRFNRQQEGIQGSVFFRAKNITIFDSKGFADTLKTDLYRYPALPPPMAWKSQAAPAPPTNLDFALTGDDAVTLTWDVPVTDADDVRFYAVYRIRAASEPAFDVAPDDARTLIAITGETTFTDRPGIATDPYYYAVTSVSANSIESTPSNVVSLQGRAVAVEREVPGSFALYANYPNPFTTNTEIRFSLDQPASATLRVFDVLGRQVATLVDEARYSAGTHTTRWDGHWSDGRPAASGTYFYTVEVEGRHLTRPMVLVR